MRDEEFSDLIRRIHQELDDLRRVLARINDGWERACRSNDGYYMDGVALNLHGFYQVLSAFSPALPKLLTATCRRAKPGMRCC
ncbi:MAG: hypothetical protein WA821_06235 [Anaerolineales bacterium]